MSGYAVTLDPGGFVVRDPSGAAVACYAARHKAQAHADRLNGQATPLALFVPVDVMPGQMAIEDGCGFTPLEADPPNFARHGLI